MEGLQNGRSAWGESSCRQAKFDYTMYLRVSPDVYGRISYPKTSQGDRCSFILSFECREKYTEFEKIASLLADKGMPFYELGQAARLQSEMRMTFYPSGWVQSNLNNNESTCRARKPVGQDRDRVRSSEEGRWHMRSCRLRSPSALERGERYLRQCWLQRTANQV